MQIVILVCKKSEKRTNVPLLPIHFICLCYNFLVTLKNTISTRYYLVLRRIQKQVLVTFIRKMEKSSPIDHGTEYSVLRIFGL